MATTQVSSISGLISYLNELGINGNKAVRDSLSITAISFVDKIKSERLSGPTSRSTISPRTGALRRGIRYRGVRRDPGGFAAIVTTDRKYANTHFGPKGSSVTIRPKNAKFLAIPLAAAKTRAGVSRGGPRSGRWGETFVRDGIIFGKKTGQRGGGQGRATGKVVPLFALVKSVTVPRRVDPKDFVKYLKDQFIQNIRYA